MYQLGFTSCIQAKKRSALKPGEHQTEHDAWDSWIVRRETDPVVTFTFDAAPTSRAYPIGRYANLETEINRIVGATVPCGVRVTGYNNSNFGSTPNVITGPTTVATVPNPRTWDSIVIERVPCAE